MSTSRLAIVQARAIKGMRLVRAIMMILLPCYISAMTPSSSSVTIGCILPLTGEGQMYGERVKAVLEMLVDDVNAGVAVGGFPSHFLGVDVVLDCRDSESEVIPAMRALHSLHADHGEELMGIIGELGDEVTVPLDFVARALGHVMISPSATTPSLGTSQHPTFVSAYIHKFSKVSTEPT